MMKNLDTSTTSDFTYKEIKPWDEKTKLWYKLSKSYHILEYQQSECLENGDFEKAIELHKTKKQINELMNQIL